MEKLKETVLLNMVDAYNSASKAIKMHEKTKKEMRDAIVTFVEENGEQNDGKGLEIIINDLLVKARIIEGKESLDQAFFEGKDYWENISDVIRVLNDEKLASNMEDGTVPFGDVEEATIKAKDITRLEIKKVK